MPDTETEDCDSMIYVSFPDQTWFSVQCERPAGHDAACWAAVEWEKA